MKFAALLGAIALLPIAFVVGYSAHQDPALPAFGGYAVEQLGVRHVPGQDSDDWIAVAVTGPNKGGAMDVAQALSIFRTHKELEASAQGKVKYFEMKCQNYSTGGTKVLYTASNLIRKSTSVQKSRKQVEKYMVSLFMPEPKS